MEKKEDRRGLIGSAGILALAAILVKFIGLLYKIPMSHLLGDEGMGYFNAAYTIYSTLYLLGSAGVPKAVTVLVSKEIAEGDKQNGARIFKAASAFFFGLGLFFFLALLLFAGAITAFIGSPRAYQAVVLISPSLLFVSLGGVYRGYLGAHGLFSATAVSSVIEGSAKLFLGLGLILLGEYYSFSLPWLSAFSVLGITVGTIVSTLYLRANIKNTGLNPWQKCAFDRKKETKKILKIALPITLGSVASGAGALVDLSVVMRRLEASGLSQAQATALYGNYTTLAVPMLQLASSLLSALAVVLLPKLAAGYAQRNKEAFSSLMHFGARTSAFVSLPLAFLFFFFPFRILALLFAEESAEIAAPVLQQLSVCIPALALLFILNTALEASQRVHLQMTSMLLFVFVKIPLTLLLPVNKEVGILAASIGTVASYFASLIFSLLCYMKIGTVKELFCTHFLPLLNTSGATLFALFVSKWIEFLPFFSLKTLIVLFSFAVFYLVSSVLTGVLCIKIPKNMSKRPKTAF